jgi:hypothetical protein
MGHQQGDQGPSSRRELHQPFLSEDGMGILAIDVAGVELDARHGEEREQQQS